MPSGSTTRSAAGSSRPRRCATAKWNCLRGTKSSANSLPSSSMSRRVARRSGSRLPRRRTTAAGWSVWQIAAQSWSGRPCEIRSSTPPRWRAWRRTCRISRRWPRRGCRESVSSCRPRQRRPRATIRRAIQPEIQPEIQLEIQLAMQAADQTRWAPRARTERGTARERSRTTKRRKNRRCLRRRRSLIARDRPIRRTSSRSRRRRKTAVVVAADWGCRPRSWAVFHRRPRRMARVLPNRKNSPRKNSSPRRSKSSGSCSRISRRSRSNSPR